MLILRGMEFPDAAWKAEKSYATTGIVKADPKEVVVEDPVVWASFTTQRELLNIKDGLNIDWRMN